MSHFEEQSLDRGSGLVVIVGSVALGLAGILPLLLYVLFGPSDGNPIGLGLLAVATVPLAGMGLVVGAIKMVVQRVGHRAD